MDYALMTAAAALGFGGAPLWLVFVIGALLTLLSSAKHAGRVRRYSDLGTARVLVVSVGASTLNNVAFAAMSFAAGRAFAWLISI